MRPSRYLRGATIVAILLVAHFAPLVPLAPVAHAQNYGDLVAEGLREFQRGNWVEAYNLFKQAHEVSPNARTLRGMGMSSYELKKYPRALDELEAALVNQYKPLHREQRDQVQGLIGLCQRLVGTLEISLEPAGAALFVNRKRTEEREVVVRVGEVTVRGELEGYEPLEREITVDGGKRYPVTMSLTPLKGTVVAAAPAATPSTETAPESDDATPEPAPVEAADDGDAAPYVDTGSSSSSLLPWSVIGVGAALAIGGFGVGVVASGKVSDASERCPKFQCPDEKDRKAAQQDNDAAVNLGIVADILVFGGLATVVTGIIMLAADGPEDRLDGELAPHALSGRVMCLPGRCMGEIEVSF